MLDFNNIGAIEEYGFLGFGKLGDLFVNSSIIPDIKGIYMILYDNPNAPEFLITGTGGHFKGKNPNISIQALKSNWIEDTKVVYIGKAGGDDSKATLRSRLTQYFRFGQRKNVGHWGGRVIWQIKNSKELLACWMPLPGGDPRDAEAELIKEFVSKYKRRPFANLAN
jgi:hypothetical protein